MLAGMVAGPVLHRLGIALLASGLAGCGAGLFTGIAASSDGGRAGGAPELSAASIVPLAPAPGTFRSIVVANAQIAAAATLRVRIDANGVGDDQLTPQAAGQGGTTAIRFELSTPTILASVADPTAADLPATLSVFVDGRLVASPLPIVLARQPRASLQLPAGVTQRFVSPLGERVAVRVDGLLAAQIADVQLLVVTRDSNAAATAGAPPPTVSRPGADLRFEAADGGVPVVSAILPGNAFPGRAEILVRDAVAGQSTRITNAWYRPDIVLALPGRGATTGGAVVTLIGSALVPFAFPATGTPQLSFDDVELSFAKGGRVTPLPREDFRTLESGVDRLVFTVPASPDGRPGQVDIVVRVQLDGAVAEVTASDEFLFANPDPFFGPRGIVLDQLPVRVAPILLDQAPGTDAAPEFAVLSEQGGVAFLQLLLAQQNGMFLPFGGPRRIGDPEVAAERQPRDLCVGDFDADGVPDVLIANAGAATAVHHLVLGQASPLPPLGAVHRVSTPSGIVRSIAARFDADATPDVLLVPGSGASPGQQPMVMLARPLGSGLPAFTAPAAIAVRDFPYEACEVADFDGDGHLDIALVSGALGKLDVAWGGGDGTFPQVANLDFTVPGYTFDAGSAAVGLHACADGAQQSLALVLAGLLSSFGGGPTQPTVTLFRQGAPRVYAAPVANDTSVVPTEPIGRSLLANLDAVGQIELVLAIRDEPQFVSLGLLQLQPAGGFVPILGSIEGGIVTGAESPRQIRALVFDRAFPVATASTPKAVFVVHETEIDGARERRLSTRLVVDEGTGQPRLLPPDAGATVNYRIERMAAGNFHPPPATGPRVRDLALARTVASAPTDAVQLVANDGFGGLPSLGNRVDFPGLLPDSLTLLPGAADGIDALAFCRDDSSLGVWRNDPNGAVVQAPDAVSTPLRAAVVDPVLQASALTDDSRVQRGDVDGDGIDDLVLLMRFVAGTPDEGQAAIALLRGKSAPAAGEFAFHVPTTVTMVHGNTSAIALGDFTRGGVGEAVRLELAVAVPQGSAGTDGDHVRFLRYAAGAVPADDGFVPAAAPGGPQVLLAGSRPTLLAAADFDRDGSIDLLVACRGDGALRLFRNTALPAPGASAVVVAAFVQALGSPWTLAPGEPTFLQLSDVDGDGNPDAVAFTEELVGVQRSTAVAVYLSSGAGDFNGPRFVSPSRVGNRNGRLSGDLGDWNRDGLPDLLFGWGTSGVGDINLRVLFGGTR